MQIDPKQRGHLPQVDQPSPFLSPDGRFRGWKVAIPGGRSLATPAVVDGRVFLGGGFGSYDFYAFDARDGRLAWQYQTSDDGPTAAVVAEGHVVFNTESCELEVLTVEGAPVWKKWLGDPLMSMPAVAAGRVYMAYPDSKGDHRHYLACFDLRTGEEYWKQPIEGEIITAPVLADGARPLRDARRHALPPAPGRRPGRVAGAAQRHVIARGLGGRVLLQPAPGGRRGRPGAGPTSSRPSTSPRGRIARRRAPLLRGDGPEGRLPRPRQADARVAPIRGQSARSTAWSGSAAIKGDAKMDQAMHNLGKGHVHEVWTYQGSKPFVHRARLYAAHGDTVTLGRSALGPGLLEGKTRPRADGGRGPARQPADASRHRQRQAVLRNRPRRGPLPVGRVRGRRSGASRSARPIVFQPAVVAGVSTSGPTPGMLICLETGDDADDGWQMWGADAAHNGKID